MKKLLLLIPILISISLCGQSTYDENFDVIGSWAGSAAGTYGAKTYTNSDNPTNDQFSSNRAVREPTYITSSPYAWRISEGTTYYFRYECEDTVQGFQVNMAIWDNSPSPTVHIRYSINSGTSFVNIDTITGATFSGDKVYQLYTYDFSSPISSEPAQKIYIEFLTVSGERMLYDDFQLTYGAVLDSATTQSQEPTDHPSGITAVSNGPVNITVSWNDSDADHYLVKGNSTGYSSIVAPVDGVAQGDSLLVKNINEAVQTHQFTGLTPNTTYYFKTFPYNGTGAASNYKLDGTVPQASAVTDVLDLDLVISEVADPRDSSLAKFVEISNIGPTTIDFSSTPVYLVRQSNGGTLNSLQINGTLTAGSSRVIGYVISSADTMRFFNAFGFVPDQYSFFVSGNGDDGYFLYYGGDHISGYCFDAYGVINVDGTSEPWEYTDKKAVRKRTVTGPSPTWNASEWVIPTVFVLAKDMTPGIYRTDITWQGNASTNWNARGANWNSPHGFIPDASSKVIIPNVSNYPVITEPAACHQIEIQSGSALIIQSTGMLLIIGQE